MATVIEKTIGSTGADYATIAAWWAAVPANLVTADEIWRGRLQNEEHSAALPVFGGKTTDGTRYAELTAVAGASWRDMPSQPMRYGYGARIIGSSEYSTMLRPDNGTKIHIRDIQIKNNWNGSVLDFSNHSGGGDIEGCLIEGPCYGLTAALVSNSAGVTKNSTIIMTSGSCQGVMFVRAGIYGCTIVNLGTITMGVVTVEYSSGVPLVDTALFGVGAANAVGGGGSFAISNCATDDATPPSGCTTVAFSTSTGAKFTNISAGTHDFRIASDSALASAGVADAQLTLDAYRVTRPNPPSIGAAEPAAGPDTTPPTLTSPTGTQTGSTTATGTVSTNEANGTAYCVVTTSATAPSVSQIQAGQNNAGAAAAFASSQAVSSTGVKTFNATGLTPSTTYYAHFQHRDAATNNSTVSTSASFTTAAPADSTPPTLTGSITIGTVTETSIAISWPAGADNIAVTSYEVSSNNGSSYTDTGSTGTTHTFTGLSAGTSYTLRVRAKDAAGNVSTPALSATQSTTADTTAPTLTTPVGVGGSLVCSGTVNTNDGAGTLYAVVCASATPPTGVQVEAGQDYTGAAALRAVSQAVSATGAQAIASGAVTAGLRYMYFMHKDAAGNRSAVAASASFTVAPTTYPYFDLNNAAREFRNNTGTLLASVSVTFWAHHPTTGALVAAITGYSTNASGFAGLVEHASLTANTAYRLDYKFSTGEFGVAWISTEV